MPTNPAPRKRNDRHIAYQAVTLPTKTSIPIRTFDDVFNRRFNDGQQVFVAKPFTDYTTEDYEFLVGVNLTGFFTTTQLAIAQMLRQGDGGHVVQVTTSLVDHANSNVPSVLASLTKGGLQSATKSLAIEFAMQGVRVNAVSPGIIQTPMHAPESYDGLAGLHPVGRMGAISDIVDGVLYLENAPFVTGEILHVDGGQSAGH